MDEDVTVQRLVPKTLTPEEITHAADAAGWPIQPISRDEFIRRFKDIHWTHKPCAGK